MADAQPFPVDYSTLKKGDVITREQVVEVIGDIRDSGLFQARLQELAQQIEHDLWDLGKHFTVRTRSKQIEILTDSEASEYNRRYFDRHRRGLAHNHRHMLAVDVGNLSPEEQRAHDRAALIQGVQLAAIVAARTEIAPVACRREHPELPPPA